MFRLINCFIFEQKYAKEAIMELPKSIASIVYNLRQRGYVVLTTSNVGSRGQISFSYGVGEKHRFIMQFNPMGGEFPADFEIHMNHLSADVEAGTLLMEILLRIVSRDAPDKEIVFSRADDDNYNYYSWKLHLLPKMSVAA